MNDFLKFVNSWKVRAFEIDMVAGYANVAHILQQRQWDLLNAESPEEILATKEVAKKALDDLKNKIRNIMLREGTLMAHDLAYVRMWFEYKGLFERSKELEKPKKGRQPTKPPESKEFFINYSTPQRDEFIRKARKDFFNDPKRLGEKIAEMEESQVLKFIPKSKDLNLTNFLKSIVNEAWSKNKDNQVRDAYNEKKESFINNIKQ